MHIKKPLPFSLTFLSLLVLLSTLFTINAFGSGPDDALTVRLLEDVEHQSANRTTLSTATSEVEPNDSYQQANSITSALMAASISPVGDVDYFSFSANAGDRLFMALESASSSASSDSLLEILDRACPTFHPARKRAEKT